MSVYKGKLPVPGLRDVHGPSGFGYGTSIPSAPVWYNDQNTVDFVLQLQKQNLGARTKKR